MVDGIVLAHPFNSAFDKVHYCTTDEEAAQVATGETIKHLRTENTDLQKSVLTAGTTISTENPDGTNGTEASTKGDIVIYTSTFYIGLNIQLKDSNS